MMMLSLFFSTSLIKTIVEMKVALLVVEWTASSDARHFDMTQVNFVVAHSWLMLSCLVVFQGKDLTP